MTTLIDELTKITYRYYKDDPNTEKIQAVVEYMVEGKVYTVTSIPFGTVTEAAACARWIRDQAFELALEAFRVVIEADPADFTQKGVKIPIH